MKQLLFILLLPVIVVVGSCNNNNDIVGGSGLIEATDVIVSSESAGRVTALNFIEGSDVVEGDTLLEIDASRLELELASANAGKQVAEAHLKTARVEVEKAYKTEQYAKSELDRVSKLVATNTATQKDLDQLEYQHSLSVIGLNASQAAISTIEAELKKIDADIARLKRQLLDCHPLSPISGTVIDKYVDKGELLAPGRPICKIADLDTVTVKVYLPANDFAGVKVGDSAHVDTESGETSYSGKIVWTSDEAEFTPKNVQTAKSRANLVYAVKVEIANSDDALKVGMPVFVTIAE
jgi:HlyD family secretion protein